MRTVGGEVAFIGAIVVDSLRLQKRCYLTTTLHPSIFILCPPPSVLFFRVRWYSSLVGKMQSLKHLKRMLLCEGVSADHVFTHTLAQGLTYRWVIAWTFNAEAAARVRSASTKDMVAAAGHLTRGPEDEGMEEGGSVLEEALALSVLLKTTLSNDLSNLRCFVDVWNQLDATTTDANRQCKAAMDRLLLVVDGQTSSDDVQSSLSDLLQADPISNGAVLMIARIHSALNDVGSIRGCCSSSSDDATHKQMLTVPVGGDKQLSVELCCKLITWAALSEAGHICVRYEVIMRGGLTMDPVNQIMEVHLRVTCKEKEGGVVDSPSSCVNLPMIRLAVSIRLNSSRAVSYRK